MVTTSELNNNIVLILAKFWVPWSQGAEGQGLRNSNAQNNVAGIQVKYLLIITVKRLSDLVYIFLTLNKLLRKEETCFSYKIFILFVLALDCYFLTSYKR